MDPSPSRPRPAFPRIAIMQVAPGFLALLPALLLALVPALLPAPARAQAASAPVKLLPLQRELLAYDHAPSRDALAAAAAASAADPAEALMALHGDPSRPAAVRVRALDGLSLFPSLAVRGYLHRLVRDATAPLPHRVHAGVALLFAYGEGAVASVAPVLAFPPAPRTLKVALADALVRYAGAPGRRLVLRARAEAKDAPYASALDRLLSPLESAAPTLR